MIIIINSNHILIILISTKLMIQYLSGLIKVKHLILSKDKIKIMKTRNFNKKKNLLQKYNKHNKNYNNTPKVIKKLSFNKF